MSNLFKTYFTIFLFLIFIFSVNINDVFAQFQCRCTGTDDIPVSECAPCLAVGCECIPNAGGGGTTLNNPLKNIEDVPTLVGKVINAILGIVGSLALVMFVFGGFTWMLAAGNNEKIKKGKDILVWATVGLVVIFSAYALVKFVFTGLGG